MRPSRSLSLTAPLALALVLSGCGGGSVLSAGGDGPAYRCAGLSISPDDLATAAPASELGPDGRAALDGMEVPDIDVDAGWLVVEEGSDHITLLRELAETVDTGGGDVHTHDVLAIQRMQGATNVEDGAWVLDLFGTCALRAEDAGAADVGDADLALATTPDPAATTMELLVTERECASGQAADGRIELLELDETDTEVRVRVGVRPLGGDQNCQGNPPTPFAIELDAPLGDRVIVDTATVPPRELRVSEDEQEQVEPEPSVDDADVEQVLSWDPPTSYVLLLETSCFCPVDRFEVVVQDGEVVRRTVVDESGAWVDEAADPDAVVAPSIAELLDRIRSVALEGGDGVLTELTVDAETGALESVRFDPLPNAVDDEIGFTVLEVSTSTD